MSDLERSIDAALHRAVLRPGLRVDHLGDERVVLDAAAGVVHTVRGAAVAELDRLVAGLGAHDREPLVALAGAGLVEVQGVSRREALALSASAFALVATTALPSAVAAASTSSLVASEGSGSVIEFMLSSPVGARLYRLANISESLSDTNYRLTVGSGTTIEVLLVAGGGAGGQPGDIESEEFFGGGGGGGEVSLVTLGSVPGGTLIDFTVAGTSAGSGRDTVLTIGSDSVTARGGGQGASRSGTSLIAAGAGGSGGGGTARSTEGGAGLSGLVVGLTRTLTAVTAGGQGTSGHRAGAGGGGSAASGSNSASAAGGNGGAGVGLAGITGWDLEVTSGAAPTSVPAIFGSGGGGAGVPTRGLSDAGGLAGRGGGRSEEGDAVSGRPGPVGSGGGGGGGIRFLEGSSYASASAGNGGSGVVWLRTQPS